MRTIDLLREDFELTDLAISVSLSNLYKGNARGFNNVRKANGRQPWGKNILPINGASQAGYTKWRTSLMRVSRCRQRLAFQKVLESER